MAPNEGYRARKTIAAALFETTPPPPVGVETRDDMKPASRGRPPRFASPRAEQDPRGRGSCWTEPRVQPVSIASSLRRCRGRRVAGIRVFKELWPW